MSDKGSVKKEYIPNKGLPFFKMECKIKIRSQLKAFKDKYVLDLPHYCTAEEVADWSIKKVITSNDAISETIHFLRKYKNNDHYSENDIKKKLGSPQYNVVFDMGFKVLDGWMKDKPTVIVHGVST